MKNLKQIINYLNSRIKSKKQIHIFEILVLFICITSIFSLFALVISQFYAIIIVILSILFISFILYIFNFKIIIKDNRFSYILFIILIFAFLLRLKPYTYIITHNDTGVYPNMAVQYNKTHSLYLTNPVTKNLNSKQNEIFANNGGPIFDIRYNFISLGRFTLPFIKDKISFIFYPLNAVWLAIFAGFLGNANMSYSLVFFSIINIIIFYLLTYELSNKNKKLACILAFLFAINPQHLMFSKSPVGEMLALTSSALSFYYLIKFYKNASNEENLDLPELSNHGNSTLNENKNKKEVLTSKLLKSQQFLVFFSKTDLILSALCINLFFYTRLTFFTYLPIYFIFAIYVLFFTKNKLKKYLIYYLITILILYIISNIFYTIFLFRLIALIYYAYIIVTLGVKFWYLKLIFILLFGFLFSIKIYYLRNSEKLKNTLLFFYNKFYIFLIFIIIICLLLSLKNFYYLAYLNKLGNLNIHEVIEWQLKDSYFSIFRSSIISSFAYFIAPIGLFLFFVSVFFIKKMQYSKILYLIYFFILIILFSLIFNQKFTYSHYYYNRYLFSEVVPYSILITVLFCNFIIKKYSSKLKYLKISTYIILFITISYYISISLPLIVYGYEGANPKFFKNLKQTINSNDLIIFNKLDIETDAQMTMFLTPITYYNNQTTLNIKNEDDLYNKDMLDLYKKYNKVYILSLKQRTNDKKIKFVKTLNYEHGFYQSCYKDPNKFKTEIQRRSSILPYTKIETSKQYFPICSYLPPTTYTKITYTLYLYEVLK